MSSEQQKQTDPTAEISNSLQPEEEFLEGPTIHANFKLYPHQMIGIPILLLIPILAVLGLFGIHTEHTQAEGEDIFITVDYPSRFRYKQSNAIEIAITNQTNNNLNEVLVQITRSYIEQFSNVEFTPQVSRITDDFYEVILPDIATNETQYVYITVQAQQAGRHEGSIVVQPSVGDTVELHLQTWAFP